MVMFALAAALLPLAMAGYIQQQMPAQQGWGQQMPAQQGWGQQMPAQQGWGGSGWGVQMTGQMVQQGGQMGGQQGGQESNQQWWGMQSEEEYNAYMKWCEERKMAMEEQEQQKELLEQIEHRQEEKKEEMEREHAKREMKMKRETMMNQWRMWNAQLASAEEFDGQMSKYEEMKIHYMFTLTMDFLKFCRCQDKTSHLQRYLYHQGDTYEADVSDAYNLDELLPGVDTNDVEATAQRMATLSQADQTKVYFGGIIESMCGRVHTYIEQVQAWEVQYNFMGV